MQPKRRQKDRPRRSFFRPPPAAVSLPPDEVTGRRVPRPHKPKPSPLMGRGVEWRTPSSLPLEGVRGVSGAPSSLPLEGKVPPKGADEVSPRSGVKLPVPPVGGVPNIPAALAATYPLRCFAPHWARFDNRHSTRAPTPTLTAVSGSGASGTSSPPNRQRYPPHQFREASTANFA